MNIYICLYIGVCSNKLKHGADGGGGARARPGGRHSFDGRRSEGAGEGATELRAIIIPPVIEVALSSECRRQWKSKLMAGVSPSGAFVSVTAFSCWPRF